MLSETENPPREALATAALEDIAALAPTLKPAELAAYIYLCNQAARAGKTSIALSTRAIATAIGMERRNVVLALSSLRDRRIIATRQGTARRPAAYLLIRLTATKISGVKKTPPASVGGVAAEGLNQPQGGVKLTPLAAANTASSEMEIDVHRSIEVPSTQEVIDRSSDRPGNERHKAECARMMHGWLTHVAKIAGHPPDGRMLAWMLRVAEWPTLEAFLKGMLTLTSPRPPQNAASPYAWLLTVAMQRIHGIAPEDQKPALELIRGGRQMRSPFAEAREAAERARAQQQARDRAEGERLAKEDGYESLEHFIAAQNARAKGAS